MNMYRIISNYRSLPVGKDLMSKKIAEYYAKKIGGTVLRVVY